MGLRKIQYLDVARGIGIISIVVGHTHSPLRDFVYLYHLPLFFFISGYLFKESYFMQPLELIRKRFTRLYLPYVTYGVIFLFLHNLLIDWHFYLPYIHKYSNSQLWAELVNILTFRSGEQLICAFWFIPTLFLIEVVLSIAGRITLIRLPGSNVNLMLAITFVFYIGGNVLSYNQVELPYYFNVVLTQSFLFFLGFIFRRNEGKIPFNPRLAGVCFLLLIVASFFFQVNLVKNNFYSSEIPYPVAAVLFPLIGLMGIYVVLYVSKWIAQRSKVSPVFEYIGSHTLSILALHFVSFKLISYVIVDNTLLPDWQVGFFPVINSSALIWWIPYTIVGIALPLLINYLKMHTIDKVSALRAG